MDGFDEKILQALSRDGRIANARLAERVGLSESACQRRVRALERAGAIRGYRASLDPAARGVGFVAYVAVGLRTHDKATQRAFETAMAAAREVRECHNVTGSIEYLLRVETADLPAYKRFHTDALGALPMLATISTYVVMGSPKDERA